MIGLKIFKWLVYGAIGLLAATYACVWLYFGVINPVEPPDHFHGAEPDLGTYVDLGDQGMTYIESTMMLGDTKYEAQIGTYRNDYHSDPPWEGFLIAITKQGTEVISGKTTKVGYPFFQRWFTKEEVPTDLWRKEVEKLVVYDPSSREATFELGFTNITCQLPPPD